MISKKIRKLQNAVLNHSIDVFKPQLVWEEEARAGKNIREEKNKLVSQAEDVEILIEAVRKNCLNTANESDH